MITNLVVEILKKYWVYLLALASIALNTWLLTRPAPTPVEVTRTEYVDKIVEKEVVRVEFRDKIKYMDRVITRTVTKPGGTKIVQETREVAGERVEHTRVHRETERAREVSRAESVASYNKTPRYLLHVGLTPRGAFDSASVGFRPVDSIPVYAGVGVSRHGSSYNLTLNLGVTF